MKLTATITTGVLCAMLTTSVVAQDTFSGVFYSLKEKSFTPVIGIKMEEAKNVFGIPGFDLTLSAMKSVSTLEGVGFAVTYNWREFSDRWGLLVGIGFSVDVGRVYVSNFGITFGVTYKF